MLTTVDPRRLLPTIRSRAVPVRLNRLTDEEVRAFLAEHVRPPLSAAALEERVALAGGSIGEALAADDDSGQGVSRRAGSCSRRCSPGRPLATSGRLKQPPFSARGEFTAMLDALADTLGDAARGALGQPTRRPVPRPCSAARDPAPLLRAMERVAEAREAAYGNVNPQILLAVLGEELAEVL